MSLEEEKGDPVLPSFTGQKMSQQSARFHKSESYAHFWPWFLLETSKENRELVSDTRML